MNTYTIFYKRQNSSAVRMTTVVTSEPQPEMVALDFTVDFVRFFGRHKFDYPEILDVKRFIAN